MSHFLFPTVAVLASVLTFLANKKLGAIRASSGLTLVSIGLLSLLPPKMIEIDIYASLVFGASFVAVAADHPIALALAEKDADLAAFADDCRRSGTRALSPPIWTAMLPRLAKPQSA